MKVIRLLEKKKDYANEEFMKFLDIHVLRENVFDFGEYTPLVCKEFNNYISKVLSQKEVKIKVKTFIQLVCNDVSLAKRICEEHTLLM